MTVKYGCPAFSAAVRINSLLKKPLNGGKPARAAAPPKHITKVTGMSRHSPPIFSIFLV